MTPQEKVIYDMLCPAIKDKKLIRFWYQDTTDKNDKAQWRTVEPHLIGLHRNKDVSMQTIQLSGWVILNAADNSDEINNGKVDKWRLYKLCAMSNLQILDSNYTKTRKDYNPKDSRMVLVYCNTQES